MRFEEVSTPVNSRIIEAASVAFERLSDAYSPAAENVHFVIGSVHRSVHSVSAIRMTSIVVEFITSTILIVVLLVAALALRVLRLVLVRARVSRLVRGVQSLALAQCGVEKTSSKHD
jgi:hypothetical protein